MGGGGVFWYSFLERLYLVKLCSRFLLDNPGSTLRLHLVLLLTTPAMAQNLRIKIIQLKRHYANTAWKQWMKLCESRNWMPNEINVFFYLHSNFLVPLSSSIWICLIVSVVQTEADPITSDAISTEIGRFRKGDCFGELELLHGDARPCTITAEVPCQIIAIEKEVRKMYIISIIFKKISIGLIIYLKMYTLLYNVFGQFVCSFFVVGMEEGLDCKRKQRWLDSNMKQ